MTGEDNGAMTESAAADRVPNKGKLAKGLQFGRAFQLGRIETLAVAGMGVTISGIWKTARVEWANHVEQS